MATLMSEVCAPETHDAMKADPARWLALPFVGIQDGAGGPCYCLRNCECRSTLAKVIEGLEVLPDRRQAL